MVNPHSFGRNPTMVRACDEGENMSVRSRRPRSQRMSSSCSTCPDDFGPGTQNKKRPDDHFCNSVQLVRQGWCQATMIEKEVFGDRVLFKQLGILDRSWHWNGRGIQRQYDWNASLMLAYFFGTQTVSTRSRSHRQDRTFANRYFKQWR